MHAAWPVRFWYSPAGQAKHSSTATPSAKLPVGHSTQLGWIQVVGSLSVRARCDAGLVEDARLVLASSAHVAAERALAEWTGVCRAELSDTGLLHKVGEALNAGGAHESHEGRALEAPALAVELCTSV